MAFKEVKKLLSSIIGIKAILAAIALVSVASVAGIAAGPSIGHPLASTAPADNLTAAQQAALSYVSQNYPGNGTAKILKTENDTEHGVPVFDIKVLAPNGLVYVVQVNQSSNQVISAHLAENQDSGEVGEGQSVDDNSTGSEDNQNTTSPTDN